MATAEPPAAAATPDGQTKSPPLTSEPRRVRYSLRLKLTLGLILMVAVVFAGVNTFNLLSHRQSRLEEASANCVTVAQLLAAPVMDHLAFGTQLNSDRVKSSLANFLEVPFNASSRNRDLVFAVVVDSKGKVVFGRARPELADFRGLPRHATEKQVVDFVAAKEGKVEGGLKLVRFPLVTPGVGTTLGKVLIGISLDRIEAEVERELIFNGGVLVAALVLIVLYSLFTLNGMVINPLWRVATAMGKVQKGDLTQTINEDRNDEIGKLADTFNFMVEGLREQERLRDAFNKYVSEKVYQKFRDGSLTLTGETREATILFSDIRAFTTLSEQLSAPEVVEMLNEYFSRMVDIVLKHDGFINKFIGDALMAIYNVPLDQPEPELRAVQTGIEMMAALDILNAERKARGLFPIAIGIGINTGPVVAGNIGHQQRLEYTVIGDAVNLASRIESQTKVAGATLLISESTYRRVAMYVVAEALPPVKVKGKAEPVPLYAIKGLKEEFARVAGSLPAPPPAAPVA